MEETVEETAADTTPEDSTEHIESLNVLFIKKDRNIPLAY